MSSRPAPRDQFRRGQSSSPGGLRRTSIDYREPHFQSTPDEDKITQKTIARARRYPMVSRGGVYLTGGELYAEIVAKLPTSGVELPEKEIGFLEDIEDRVRAHAEVRRPFRASRRQKQWLSDIWRRVHGEQREDVKT